MKRLIISSVIAGIFSVSSISALASESLLEDLEQFEIDQAKQKSSGQLSSQPEIGSAATSYNLFEDLYFIQANRNFKPANYSSGSVGSESLWDDLDRF